ncbi:MAG TPA: helix-turn-helix domain-containing protein, partial [Candidatus Eisenbacteria bacterium]|nr:helix-turn-helix domain-containing protein [Candidatus Eisenbacteria bacterium]
MSDLLLAVAEPRRQAILHLIWRGEREAGEIHRAVGGITFGAVSQHLRVLREAGAVHVRKDGRRRL